MLCVSEIENISSMFGRSSATFDRLLEKATSQLLLEPDWTSIMMICDSIRQGDTNPKYAVTAIKKKFYHSNPHVALYALQVNIETSHITPAVFYSQGDGELCQELRGPGS